ncbi:MAG TPA: site-specific DNA-methyltransferase [Herpetosiphon sp.]|uniref:DNA methylase N-4/N-6 domain protein n=1 Tax=Herpetosiphon aurantiacus (strain ATCC 23779 / DSM 785 / 114-95) TaxID=316274 RepID=A9B1V2_HERA2|nr:site-specific DNA-methyltransferase [Herpetosiphon sp.]ABX05394.1 DNA methylase N-4/N-6 domain protein [Herpetosiphon aurantiacus DSM 785]HBW48967.1 site-specific DNA-methyltransferase [Herpetosiphon sp.]
MPDHPSKLFDIQQSLEYHHRYSTDLGSLYQGDCLNFLQAIPSESIDMVFADPPFNLGKNYGKGINDQLLDAEYLEWSYSWISELIRIIKPGGAILLFNLPKWLISYGSYLNQAGMMFRHWIACRMPKAFPRGKKLSPAHYGLLYYTKGEPSTFNKVYIPIPVCRHCGKEIRDYGGHRKKLNPQGLNLMDIFDMPEEVWCDESLEAHSTNQLWTPAEDLWDDIPTVRHSKHKTRGANELAPIMLERLIALTTNPHDLILDPFGGSGTTYYAAEKLQRRWIGIEIGEIDPAIQRLQNLHQGQVALWESARGIV